MFYPSSNSGDWNQHCFFFLNRLFYLHNLHYVLFHYNMRKFLFWLLLFTLTKSSLIYLYIYCCIHFQYIIIFFLRVCIICKFLASFVINNWEMFKTFDFLTFYDVWQIKAVIWKIEKEHFIIFVVNQRKVKNLLGISWKRYPQLPVSTRIDRQSPLNECALKVHFIWNQL